MHGARGAKGAEADEPKPKRQATGGRPTGEIVEEGRITFLYRPKVGVSEVQSVDDVQRCVSCCKTSVTSRDAAFNQILAPLQYIIVGTDRDVMSQLPCVIPSYLQILSSTIIFAGPQLHRYALNGVRTVKLYFHINIFKRYTRYCRQINMIQSCLALFSRPFSTC